MNLAGAELEIGQFGLDGLAETFGRFGAARAQLARCREILFARGCGTPSRDGRVRLAALQQVEIVPVAVEHGGEFLDDDMMLAGHAAQGEEAGPSTFSSSEGSKAISRFSVSMASLVRSSAVSELSSASMSG